MTILYTISLLKTEVDKNEPVVENIDELLSYARDVEDFVNEMAQTSIIVKIENDQCE